MLNFILGMLFMAFLHPILLHIFFYLRRVFYIRKALKNIGLKNIGAYTKPRIFYMREIGEWRDD